MLNKKYFSNIYFFKEVKARQNESLKKEKKKKK